MEIRKFKEFTMAQKLATLCYNFIVIVIYLSLIVDIINFDINMFKAILLIFLGNYLIYSFFMFMAFKKKPSFIGYLKSYKII
ncbi:hypothetical protein [Caloramator proteoclasticus]|uniref:Uncharacterized protein n=1 Tax=Caloramator proteoclasticus DSM 10124 TaxID=1121262 RepID=A0A1M4X8H4_9CLOT|nr:hypothetical protein [Caloramator proteoclasticus]SHE89733.1 hypothetical protein SAMN02746091_01344 [Caloramator proteoclasticus DSM 10124]